MSLFAQLKEIMAQARVRSPWTKVQTPKSIAHYTMEEVHEVLEAIDADDMPALKDELADLLYHILFYSQMASERPDGFSVDDVCQHLIEKREKRAYYLMSDNPSDWPQTEEEEWQIWLTAKQQHKEKLADKKPLENLFAQQTKGLPILQQLEKTIKNYRMWDGGHIYPPTDHVDLFELLQGEVAEVKQELDAPTLNKQRLQDELGDVVLNLATLAVQYDVSLETAAMSANKRFQTRFLAVENAMFAAGVSNQKWHELTPQQRLDLWHAAKRLEEEKA